MVQAVFRLLTVLFALVWPGGISALELMVGPSAMARPFAAPPGMPADKAALLRRAFAATMQDGEFHAEAARMKADLAPTMGEDVQKLVARIYATPRPVVERVKKLLAP
jgi:tripartite-type tricarboxylate transporter receptor subunit TctC